MSTYTSQSTTSQMVNPVTRLARTSLVIAVLTGVLAVRLAHGQEHEHGGHCIDRNGMSVMFEPGTSKADAESMAADHGGNAGNTIAFAPAGGIWQLTATDGLVDQGQSITLTYSFVPDGTSIQSSYADDATVSNLFATLDANFPGGRSAWKQQFASMFEDWSSHTNITYVEVADDGAPWSIFNIGILGTRGDIRIAMHPVGDGPLAYNNYPNFGGDMVLDSLDVGDFTNPSNNFRALRNVLFHEHGHGLGMGHVIPQNGTKIMEPVLNTGFDGPQEDDVRAAQFLYGDNVESNDSPENATFLGGSLGDEASFGVQTFVVEDVALERADSSDWYSFTAFGGTRIAARLEPVGSTYDFGPQNGTTQTIDASAARNLNLRVYRRVSAQTGEVQLINRIDFNEAGEAENHPLLLFTVAGMMYAEVYSDDGVEDVQAYKLTISNVAIDEPVDPPALFVADGVVPVNANDTFFMEETIVGESTGKALTIRNLGDGPLQFEGTPHAIVEGVGAADFTAELVASELPAGGFTVLGITFQPTQPGVRVAIVRIPNNDPNQSDYSFIVRGTATASVQQDPDLLVTKEAEIIEDGDTVLFEDALIGEATSEALAVRNVGLGLLAFDGVPVVSGPGAAAFTASLVATEVEPGSLTILGISFEPTQPGEHVAVVSIPNNDPDEGTFSFLVSATAVAQTEAILEVSWEGELVDANDLLDFGDVEIGDTVETTLSIRNVGDAQLELTGVLLSGDAAAEYSVFDGIAALAPGDTLTVPLSVTPTAAGSREATLTIVSNATTGAFSLALTTNGFEEILIDDCNLNSVEDADELAAGAEDCNENSVLDECETDTDADGVIDDCDTCIDLANVDQDDADGDGFGDLCDICPDIPNADQTDSDGDDVGDGCDNCPETSNADQADANGNGVGDACELVDAPPPFTPEKPQPIGGFCGAGALGLIPAMMFGLCGMRPRRRM